MTPDYLRMIIKKIAKKVGLPWIHPHSLRHYAATNWLRAGMNIKIVQELLGHSQLSTTEIYLHITEEDKAKAIKNPAIEDPLLKKSMNAKNWGVLVEITDKVSYGPAEI